MRFEGVLEWACAWHWINVCAWGLWVCACGYICQIINKHWDKDHMCASLCTSPTSLPPFMLAQPVPAGMLGLSGQQRWHHGSLSNATRRLQHQFPPSCISYTMLGHGAITPTPTAWILYKPMNITELTRTASPLSHMSPGNNRNMNDSISGLNRKLIQWFQTVKPQWMTNNLQQDLGLLFTCLRWSEVTWLKSAWGQAPLQWKSLYRDRQILKPS